MLVNSNSATAKRNHLGQLRGRFISLLRCSRRVLAASMLVNTNRGSERHLVRGEASTRGGILESVDDRSDGVDEADVDAEDETMLFKSTKLSGSGHSLHGLGLGRARAHHANISRPNSSSMMMAGAAPCSAH